MPGIVTLLAQPSGRPGRKCRRMLGWCGPGVVPPGCLVGRRVDTRLPGDQAAGTKELSLHPFDLRVGNCPLIVSPGADHIVSAEAASYDHDGRFRHAA